MTMYNNCTMNGCNDISICIVKGRRLCKTHFDEIIPTVNMGDEEGLHC